MNYYAFNGTSLYKGTGANIGYAFTGVPGGMPNLPGSQYAQFTFNNNVVAFPRVNYQLNDYSNGSNVLRFKKGGFDSGSINISNPTQVADLLGKVGTQLNLTGVLEIFGETLEEEGKKGKKKSFEEIVNLVLNYGTKALSIAIGLGLLKKKDTDTGLDDGWGNVDGTGLDEIPADGLPQQKPVESGSGTILGFKTENVLLTAGGLLMAFAIFKK